MKFCGYPIVEVDSIKVSHAGFYLKIAHLKKPVNNSIKVTPAQYLLFDNSGAIICRCGFLGVNLKKPYGIKSAILYHNNMPTRAYMRKFINDITNKCDLNEIFPVFEDD